MSIDSSATVEPPSQEHRVLLGYLQRCRDAVVGRLDGLDETTLRTPGVPSGTNLLGLVWHLAGVERHWLGWVFLGDDVEVDRAMQAPDDVGVDDVVERYRDACRATDMAVLACPDLATRAARPNPGEDVLDPLRSIVVHLVEETARHAGHADVIRERIDGVTG